MNQWTVVLSDCFQTWLQQQDEACANSVLAALLRLQAYGPMLARPYADTVKGSAYSQMKELRIQHQGKPIRAFFAFDPVRQAVVLCAGDKSNDKNFYRRMISLADREFTQYLNHLETQSCKP